MASLINQILSYNTAKPLNVIAPLIQLNKFASLDLSIKNEDLQEINVSSSLDLGKYIDKEVEKQHAKIAFGGYLEKRNIYQRSEYFNNQTDPKDERNIHLGIDFWINEGTNVHAFLEGKVHSFKNNKNHGDYGPTIILEHQINEITFFSLYGHLSEASIDNLEKGKIFKEGEVIAQLGGPEVNGDYPPHLHFQVIIDLQGKEGDYPGVCSENELSFYKENCPNPSLLFGLNSL